MQFLLEIFPIAVFFIAYKLSGTIIAATIAAIIATAVQVVWQRLSQGYFKKSPLISLVMITIFGGATIIFNNDWFIKWKPSVVYWLLAIGLICNQLFSKKLWLTQLAGDKLTLPTTIWLKVNFHWALFFIVMGIANIVVAYNFSTNIWVNYKLFGTMFASIIFMAIQVKYISKYQAVTNEPNIIEHE